MTKLFIEGTAVSRLLSLFHFDNNANYATLLATELEKLLRLLICKVFLSVCFCISSFLFFLCNLITPLVKVLSCLD